MRLRFLGAAIVAALGVILMPGAALPVAQISDDQAEVADYDSRTGAIAPTRLQRAHAKQIKAKVTWNRFGTPASVSRPGKFLAKGIRAKTAQAAASWYLKRHKALFGLRSLPESSRVCIVTDSTLMIDSMTKWIHGWKRRGWKTAAGDPVKNQDLVTALDDEIGRHAHVRWHWVRGHETGAEHAHKALNDRADRLAVAAAQAAA